MARGAVIGIFALIGLACGGVAAAQTFYNFHCDDGSELAVGFFDGDSRAHIQLNGKTLALPKRLTLSGARYSASGVQLRMTKDATTFKDVTTLKHGRRPWAACTARKDW